MKRFRFAVGFIAAIFDEAGMIRTRNAIGRTVRKTGRYLDGFDSLFDLIRR
jgi:hypothetical protein